MISALPLIITVLAVCRLTRLITKEAITLPIRRFVIKHSGMNGWWTFLVHCPYCLSVWISIGAAVLYYFFRDNPIYQVVAIALAFAQVVVFVTKLDEAKPEVKAE